MANLIERLGFRLMALTFKVRDLSKPPEGVLQEVGVREGQTVLDYGCGPGSFSIAAAKLIGPRGKVYAADISDNAIKYVQKVVARKQIKNIEVIKTDCFTGLPNSSVDVVMLFDIYHGLEHPHNILKEIQRVLKDEGTLSVNDHHLTEAGILIGLQEDGLFKLMEKTVNTYNFKKQLPRP